MAKKTDPEMVLRMLAEEEELTDRKWATVQRLEATRRAQRDAAFMKAFPPALQYEQFDPYRDKPTRLKPPSEVIEAVRLIENIIEERGECYDEAMDFVERIRKKYLS